MVPHKFLLFWKISLSISKLHIARKWLLHSFIVLSKYSKTLTYHSSICWQNFPRKTIYIYCVTNRYVICVIYMNSTPIYRAPRLTQLYSLLPRGLVNLSGFTVAHITMNVALYFRFYYQNPYWLIGQKLCLTSAKFITFCYSLSQQNVLV